MNTFNIRLDLDKSPGVPEIVTIRQGDMSGTTINATIYDHGSLLTGSYSSRIAISLPDGEHYYRKNATFSSGVASVTIDETEAASIAGSSFGYFEILSGSTVIASTANFIVRILQSATADAVPGEPYDDAIQDAIDRMDDAVDALPDTVEGILEDHPEWTTTVEDFAVTRRKLNGDIDAQIDAAFLQEDISDTLTWQQGAINGTTGGTTNMNQTNRVRVAYFTPASTTTFLKLELPSGMSAQVLDYIESTYQGRLFSAALSGPIYWPMTQGHRYRFWVKYDDDSDISPTDEIISSIKLYTAKGAEYMFGRAFKTHNVLIGTGNYEEMLPDLDTAAINTSFVIASGMGSYISNMPPSKSAGVLLTFSGRNTLSGCMQLYADAYDYNGAKRLWYRQNWGNLPNVTWSDWRSISFDTSSDYSSFTDMSMFQRIGVIGDSYCSGSLYLAEDDKHSNYSQSWGANLARQHGIEFVPYAVGGWGTYNFVNSTSEYGEIYGALRLQQDFSDPDRICGLYIIAYGINDSNPTKTFGDKTGGAAYIGSSADINESDYTQNANSYWGNMSRIISMIKAGAPDALIVITTLARFGTSRYDNYSAEIPDIAAANGVRYITLTDDEFFTSAYFTHLSYDHPTAQLYAGMARAISRLIQRDMVENWSYYQYFRGINNPRS